MQREMEEPMDITAEKAFTATNSHSDVVSQSITDNNCGGNSGEVGPSRSGRSSANGSNSEPTGMNEECLDILENLLVPYTVLSTTTGTPEANKSSPQTIKKTVTRKPKELPTKNATKASVKEVPSGASDALRHSNEENSQDEDDEEDEFEDEGEFEIGKKFGTRAEEELRRRQPVIIPMPVMKRASLCLKEKVAIIKELENGEKQSWICKRKRLPKSTVQSIWKNRLKILEASEKIGMGRKRCRRAQHEDLEDKLVAWIESLKSQNVPVNGPQLRAKAQVFAKQLGVSEFRSSTGWLDKFKTRHNIAFKKSPKVDSGSSSGVADKKLAIDWVTKVWPNLCEGYTPENIFNADEFGIFYKTLPDLTNKLMNETCHGGRMPHDRLTVLLCTNSDGSEKRPLTVVGNANIVAPINMKNLPVRYVADSKSWITRSIFAQELREWNEELEKTNRNVLLILDNSPAHTTSEEYSNINLVFLPPVVASILQPLEHGITDLVKLQYRRLLIDKVLRKWGVGPEQMSKTSDHSVNIMEAIIMLDCAWSSVSSESILECFKISNLQSINVTNSASASAAETTYLSKSESDIRLDAQMIERLVTFMPYLHIPHNMSLGLFNQIDAKLHVTDYINEEQPHKPGENQLENVTVAALNAPNKFQVQEYLTSIRNWILSLPTDLDDRSVHESLSVLENFSLRQANEVLRPNHSPQLQLFSTPTATSHVGPSHNQQMSRNSLSTAGRMIFNGPLNSNVSMAQPSVLTLPTHHNTNSHSGAPTVVTFALADSVSPPTIPHHFMDQQQFYAYLS